MLPQEPEVFIDRFGPGCAREGHDVVLLSQFQCNWVTVFYFYLYFFNGRGGGGGGGGIDLADEGRHYFVMPSLIGWVQA